MIQMVLLYLIAGLTWGIVLTIIQLQEGQKIDEVLREMPHTDAIVKVAICIVVIYTMVFWPIEAPRSVLGIIKRDLKKGE